MKCPYRLTAVVVAAVLTIASANVPPAPQAPASPSQRIASFFISENLMNELLRQYLNTPFLKDVKIVLDPQSDQIEAQGLIKVPMDQMRAINLDPSLSDFRFQLAIKLKTTRHGHLILIFPLDQTFFYPAISTNPTQDRIVIPPQLISLALASARGYLAVLSGDLSSFDRRTTQLQQELTQIDQHLASSQDPDEKETLQMEKKSIQTQIDATALQRRQAEKSASKMQGVFGFVGEKEINLNQELSARRNALVLKIHIGQLAPYLQNIELGGVRLLKDERDGSGENFLAVDLNAQIPGFPVDESSIHKAPPKQVIQQPPDVVIRLNQAMLEDPAVLNAEHQDLAQHIRNFAMDLKADGIHVTGFWKIPILPDIPFEAIIDFTWVSANVFDIQIREMKVLHVDLKSLARIVLESAKKRIDATLKGACTFDYVGEEKDRSRAIRVTVNMPALLPAFPKLALTGVRVKEKELILKAARPFSPREKVAQPDEAPHLPSGHPLPQGEEKPKL